MASLKLDLSLEKNEFVRGESIRFVVALTNVGGSPVTVATEKPKNRAFAISVKSPWGGEVRGDALTMAEREGEHVDEPRDTPTRLLAQGEKLVARGDVIPWLGELEPGEYTIEGIYEFTPALSTVSAPATFKVVEAAPVYARTARPNFAGQREASETAWLHKTGAGHGLYLMRSSPKSPLVAYSNTPLAQLPFPAEVIPSCHNSVTCPSDHLVWMAEDGSLQVLRHKAGVVSDPILSVPLPSADLEPVGTPYSDGKGNLHLVLAAEGGTPAFLCQVSDRTNASFRPFDSTVPLGSPRSVLWGGDETLTVAWVGADEREVMAATVSLAALPPRIAGKKLLTASHAVIDLSLAQRSREEAEGYERLLFVLAFDDVKDILYRTRVNLSSSETGEPERFVVDGVGNLVLRDSILDEDLNAQYLFAGADGAVVHADGSFSRLVPVLTASRRPVTVAHCPGLVVTSKFSKLRGAFLRYIEDGRKLACVKLGS
jgi:hypothetical protein